MLMVLRLALVAMVAVSSIGLAAARGQVRVADQIVICAGGSVTTITLDENGQPVDHVLICPDMALGLMVALAAAPVLPIPPAVTQRFRPFPEVRSGVSRIAPPSRARDPPGHPV